MGDLPKDDSKLLLFSAAEKWRILIDNESKEEFDSEEFRKESILSQITGKVKGMAKFRDAANVPEICGIFAKNGIAISAASVSCKDPNKFVWKALLTDLEELESKQRQLDANMDDITNLNNSLFDAQAPVDDESSFDKFSRLSRIYIDEEVADKIIENILVQQHYQACKCEFSPQQTVSKNNQVFLIGPTQNGKTKEMLALSWIGFFKHGLATYLFLRSDATAYSEIKQSVEEFNRDITNWLYEQQCNGIFKNKSGIDRGNYCLQIETLQTKANLELADIFHSSNQPCSEIKAVRPLIRCRLLQAGNVERAQVLESEMSLMVSGFGVSEDGSRLQIMVIVDESQNTRQSFEVKHKLERALYAQRDQSKLIEAAQEFCRMNNLKTKGDLNKTLRKPLSGLCALYVEVTATPEPSFIILRRRKNIQLLECKIHKDYFGYHTDLPAKQKIITETFRTFLGITPEIEADPRALTVAACLNILARSKSSPRPFAEHVLVYHRLRMNDDMVQMAKELIHQCEAEEKMIVVLCAYARNAQTGFGQAMYMNRSADQTLKPHLLRAQSEIFISAEEYREAAAKSNVIEFVERPKNNTFVYLKGREHPLIYLKNTMGHGLIEGECEDYNLSQPGEVHLPSKMPFRVRTALTLIQEACKIAKKDLTDLFIVTLGKTLLREGLTVKTWNHNLPPTFMLCPMDDDALKRLNQVQCLQALGRLCGIRQPPYDIAPVLILQSSAEPIFQQYLETNRHIIDAVKRLQTQGNLTIGQALLSHNALKSFEGIPEYICKKQVQRGDLKTLFESWEAQQAQSIECVRDSFKSIIEKYLDPTELRFFQQAFDFARDDPKDDIQEDDPSLWVSYEALLTGLKIEEAQKDRFMGMLKKLERIAESEDPNENEVIMTVDIDDPSVGIDPGVDGLDGESYENCVIAIATCVPNDSQEEQEDERGAWEPKGRSQHTDRTDQIGLYFMQDLRWWSKKRPRDGDDSESQSGAE